jgi:hypothetical protein
MDHLNPLYCRSDQFAPVYQFSIPDHEPPPYPSVFCDCDSVRSPPPPYPTVEPPTLSIDELLDCNVQLLHTVEQIKVDRWKQWIGVDQKIKKLFRQTDEHFEKENSKMEGLACNIWTKFNKDKFDELLDTNSLNQTVLLITGLFVKDYHNSNNWLPSRLENRKQMIKSNLVITKQLTAAYLDTPDEYLPSDLEHRFRLLTTNLQILRQSMTSQ